MIAMIVAGNRYYDHPDQSELIEWSNYAEETVRKTFRFTSTYLGTCTMSIVVEEKGMKKNLTSGYLIKAESDSGPPPLASPATTSRVRTTAVELLKRRAHIRRYFIFLSQTAAAARRPPHS
jgi:hypothetical protein